MQTGTKISGLAHIALIGLALFGGAFRSEPLPFEVREVSVVTAEEYAAALRVAEPPETVTEPAALPTPEVSDATPDVAARPDTEPDQVQPDPADAPVEEALPERLPDPAPPQAEVSDTAPGLQSPEPPAAVVTPTPTPAPRPADRVAPQPVAPPPPLARPDDVARPDVSPDEGAETPQEVQEATAPEEATDRIVTEADETGSAAPARSVRPRTRPQRQAETPAPVPAPDTEDAVNAALREALGTPSEEPAPARPAGPPLSQGEKDALRVSVERCWNVGSLSSAALATTVVVGVSMTPEGKPQVASIRLISSEGGDDQAARKAFDAARRAIILCGADGYELPPEKYEHWREIEMTFNPERMRNR